ncbi:Response regulator SaeR (plasmid) [Sulfitobacter indolifex]|uniref:Response regulator receiver domain protein (CheY-like) n=1 Tax=Sulfitobacter indolifex HEL-45 TaxID=391624 RepID=A0ABP2D4K4_9RHOB|nr:response regulator [Sulfitobacter indolifex]EDQ03246.1 response regulator receiver domain protein (CheY-like) [Sulfitobacter indolifex HEL-45]UOA20769.1 Response regulator SaeR [Sulfitobacter indolifex]
MIKLLHVDDDADILELTQISLEFSENFEVVGCLSGTDALFAVEQFLPDVFLLDVMMPGLTGPDLLKKLWDIPSLQSVPAIFMTARVNAASRAHLFGIGAKEVIEKPFDPMTLNAQILTAMDACSIVQLPSR